MLRSMRGLAIAFALIAVPLGTAGCNLLQDPATIEGALPSEANELRVIQAALVVKTANQTIGQQLDAGLISPGEASRLRGLTKQAETALAAAREVLPLEDGTTAERIAAVNVILIRLLREQVIKQGVQ